MEVTRQKAVLSGVILILLAVVFTVAGQAGGRSEYPRTIDALKRRYADEVGANCKYMAYAQKALSESHRNLAYLFVSLAASESVHARNFEGILRSLGVEVEKRLPQAFEVRSSRENLRHAISVEAGEIDKAYPQILDDIRSENHAEVIRMITYAWKAEAQHRDLMRKMDSAAKWWFRILVRRIEKEAVKYNVCRICGSTLVELPEKSCPICGNPVSNYKEVEAYEK
jgi:rubrerythrin